MRRGASVAAPEKRAIGQRAAEMIPDGCSVIVNVGTTTEEVARALVARRDLVVITNNLNVVAILSGTPQKELILAGGVVRQTDGAIVGDEAVAFIRRFKADYRGDRRLGAGRGRGDPRLRHARGGGGARDRRERAADDPGLRPAEVRAQRAGPDLRRGRRARLRHRRRRRRLAFAEACARAGVEIAVAAVADAEAPA